MKSKAVAIKCKLLVNLMTPLLNIIKVSCRSVITGKCTDSQDREYYCTLHHLKDFNGQTFDLNRSVKILLLPMSSFVSIQDHDHSDILEKLAICIFSKRFI